MWLPAVEFFARFLNCFKQIDQQIKLALQWAQPHTRREYQSAKVENAFICAAGHTKYLTVFLIKKEEEI